MKTISVPENPVHRLNRRRGLPCAMSNFVCWGVQINVFARLKEDASRLEFFRPRGLHVGLFRTTGV
jgi:hypothetical protein